MTYTKQYVREVQAGVNYQRLLKTMSIDEIEDQMNVTKDHIHRCIKIARAHKEASEKKPEVKFKEPMVKLFYDLRTGEKQIVKSIEIELMNELQVNFGYDEVHEFTKVIPIKVTVRRA